jgi:hypothetical protein
MDELFTYYDMFATKGDEYLIIIAVLVLMIVFWKFLYMKPY